jgi:hypothetical protein
MADRRATVAVADAEPPRFALFREIALEAAGGARAGFLPGREVGCPSSPPSLDASGKQLAGSISEKIQVTINGIPQGMFIMGKDTRNPVLLFLHRGTAMPEYFLTQNYPAGLEQYFTVC